jgi:hypothetical protein
MKDMRLASELGRIDLGYLLKDLASLDAAFISRDLSDEDLRGLHDVVVGELIELLRLVDVSYHQARADLRRAT